MKISSVEIQNFRKLKSTRIDFDENTTLFVGANNSGKTSAMLALRYFLVAPRKLSLCDITIGNWTLMDAIGRVWEKGEVPKGALIDLLPKLDIWLEVPLSDIHHVVHVLPTINWSGGKLGVRLQYEPDKLDKLHDEYLAERKAVADALAGAKTVDKVSSPHLWPRSLTHYLERHLSRHLRIRAYALDPGKFVAPKNGTAQPQALPEVPVSLDDDPFRQLIRVDEIAAQRDFADAGDRGSDSRADGRPNGGVGRFKRRLSVQLRSYYDRHLDPAKTPSTADIEALGAIQSAEEKFDVRLKLGFKAAFAELEDLGYPGVTNPKLEINTQLRATDGLKHGAAIRYKIADHDDDDATPLHLPEDYSGLGYQNLISMVFMLMSYRDDWMRVGKAKADLAFGGDDDRIPRLHLVLVEEPEAHLHAQVQQVFINKAYKLLRNHEDLGDASTYATQLIVSTHSSHVAHEADFSNLRYFRRRSAVTADEAPTTTIANLSQVFGDGDKTQRFVKRYLKATHCDLFFADAAIFAEGQAERILVPHFIRHHYADRSRRYITLLDLGGSHAHKFEDLVHALGLTTLIISDLDAGVPTPITTKSGVKTTRVKAAKPQKGHGQETTNPVLKGWHPKLASVDALLDLEPEGHVAQIHDDYDLYVAFQKAVPAGNGEADIVIPRTFEDALIFANQDAIKDLIGSRISERIKEIVAASPTGDALADELFDLLKGAEKAAFALDCLMMEDPKALVAPPYVHDGLTWLQTLLNEKSAGAPPGQKKL